MHSREVLAAIERKFPHLEPTRGHAVWQYFSNASDLIVEFFNELPRELEAAKRDLESGSAQDAGNRIRDLIRRADEARAENNRRITTSEGEDVTFCRRALDAGHQPHVDFAVHCGHADGENVWGLHNTDQG